MAYFDFKRPVGAKGVDLNKSKVPVNPTVHDFEALYNNSSVTNPYTTLDVEDYTLNRRGQLKYQQDLAAAQYAAEVQLMMYQNQYNSPEAQAERQRAAGINPDLAGVSGESAAGMQGNVTPPNMSGIKSNEEIGLGIVDTTLSLMMAVGQGVFGIMNQAAAMDGKQIDNAAKIFNLAPAVGNFAGQVGRMSADPVAGMFNTHDIALKSVPRRYRRTLEDYLVRYMDTPSQLKHVYDSEADKAVARGRFASTQVDPTMKGEVEDLMKAMKPLREAEFEVAKLLLKEASSKSRKMSHYWMNKDMGQQAEMENSEADSEIKENQITEIIRKGALRTVDWLQSYADDGALWANTALTSLYMALAGANNVLPSLSASSSQGEGSDGQIFNNSSWNIGF